MTSYLVQGLLGSTTSLLVEGFSLNTIKIKLYFYLNNFSIDNLVAFNYLKLISTTKLSKITVNYKHSKLNIVNKNKITKYKISKYSYLNKINVN